MPTPIGHALAGAIVFYSLPDRIKNLTTLLIAAIFFSLLPDIDFLFGFPLGDPNRFHHNFTHSFVFVIVMGLIGGLLYAKLHKQRSLIYSAIFVSAGISHVILDVLAVDKRAPFGCPIFWPFSQEFYISPIVLFSDVSRVSDSRLFLQSLFSVHNLATICVEALVLIPILLYFVWRKNRNHV
jgi:membrane-bound metal-dependent hydrolase YbcI (DUF457 family)